MYGYAGDVTINYEGLIEAGITRTASESEMSVFPEIMTSACIAKGKTVLYDKRVVSQTNRDTFKHLGLKNGIMLKKPKDQLL